MTVLPATDPQPMPPAGPTRHDRAGRRAVAARSKPRRTD
jgi:hypothetical protein